MDRILARLKDLWKTILIERFVIGPLLTLAALAVHAWAVSIDLLPPSAAGLYLFVLLAGFIGGVRAGVISAAMLAAYNVYFLGPMNLERWLVLASYFIAAGLIGAKTRQWRAALANALAEHTRADVNQEKADIVDSFNGNVALALSAIDILDSSFREMAAERGFVLGEGEDA